MIVWDDSKCKSDKGRVLFEIFSEHYARNDLKVLFVDGETIIVKKYNVLGLEIGNDYFTLYEDASQNKRLGILGFDTIKQVELCG